MWDLKACAVCFSTSAKLFSLNQQDLRKQFNLISGLTTCSGGGSPEYLCVECSAYVRKFIKFRDKCQRAHYAFQYLLSKNTEIRKSDLKLVNREELNIMPSLSYIDLDKVYYQQMAFQSTQAFRRQVTPLEFIPIFHISTLTPEDTFESVTSVGTRNLLQQALESADIKKEATASDIFDLKSDNEDKAQANTNKFLTIEVCPLNIAKQTFNNDSDDCFNGNDGVLSDGDNSSGINQDNKLDLTSKLTIDVTGSAQNEEYAQILPITATEAMAVAEIVKKVKQFAHKCECGWSTNKETLLIQHSRMHNKHISGNFHCDICNYYYKTNFMLQCHMSDKHMYKYICKKCKDVNFDRGRAKQHYIVRHMNRTGNWENGARPKWVAPRNKPVKAKKSIPKQGKSSSLYINGVKKVPKKYLSFTPIKPEEQYSMVENRKNSKNYLCANFKCELCYKGFRCTTTFNKHMAKHDPDIAGKYQCDVCKIYFPDTRRLYKHILTNHLVKYSCKLCDFFSTDRGQANLHVSWHQNITYPCPHCDRKFMKMSTQLTHVRIKHPSTFICKQCGHSFVSSHGLFQHLHMTHTKEEIEAVENHEENTEDPFYCKDCKLQFMNDIAFATHLQSSSKHVEVNFATVNALASERRKIRGAPTPMTPSTPSSRRKDRRRRRPRTDVHNAGLSVEQTCDLCDVSLPTDVEASRHYKTEHPGYDYLKRYMCDVCGHTTRQYANLLAHMRIHTREKPFACPHCDRKFSMPSNRDRHIVVHTGEKRYQCQHCSRRFTQSSAVKLHIQTVHLKIPYAPWDKKKRKRKKDMEPTTADLNVVAPHTLALIQPTATTEHKIVIDSNPTEYINAYITYADE